MKEETYLRHIQKEINKVKGDAATYAMTYTIIALIVLCIYAFRSGYIYSSIFFTVVSIYATVKMK